MGFNIDMEDILILDEKDSKPDAKFKLEMSNSPLESGNISQLDSIRELLRNNIGKEAANGFTRDDLKFEEESNNHDIDDVIDLD